MYIRKSVSIFLTSILVSIRLQAEEPATNEAIQKQLLEMQKSIQEIQTHHQSELDLLKKQIADQQTVIESLKQTAVEVPPATAPFPTEDAMVVPSSVPEPMPNTLPAPAGAMFPTTDSSVVTDSGPAGPSPGLIPAPPMIGGGGGASKGS